MVLTYRLRAAFKQLHFLFYRHIKKVIHVDLLDVIAEQLAASLKQD